MKRRDFFKITALASGAALSACNNRVDEKILPYLVPPEDGIVPGVARYINSTCTGCPAGCGIKVKIIDGEAVKVEGNPSHPVNKGGLCILGQASIAGIYHPKRILKPHGKLSNQSWEEAVALINSKIEHASKTGKKNILIDNLYKGTIDDLIDEFCTKKGFEKFKLISKLDYSAISDAYGSLFGYYTLPQFKIDNADFLLTIGADILDTFINPPGNAKMIREAKKKGLNWIHVSDTPSLTGYSADEKLKIKHGSEKNLLAFIEKAVGVNNANDRNPFPKPDVLRKTSQDTGLTTDMILKIIKNLQGAEKPLIITGGPSLFSESGKTNAKLTALIQYKLGMIGKTIIIKQAEKKYAAPKNYFSKLKKIGSENIEVAIIFGGSLKQIPNEVLKKVTSSKFSVLITDILAEEKSDFDLILPMATSFESWGDRIENSGLTSVIQPSVIPRGDSLSAGDIILKFLSDNRTWQQYLIQTWKHSGKNIKTITEEGFIFKERKSAVLIGIVSGSEIAIEKSKKQESKIDAKNFVYFKPDIRKFDGRGTDLSLLNEIPDPLTTITYGDYIEISPTEADRRNISEGDEINISGEFGSLILNAVISENIQDGAKIISLSSAAGIDFPLLPDTGTSKLVFESPAIKKTGENRRIPRLSGSFSTAGREIFPSEKNDASHHGKHQLHTLYPKHEHNKYRWAMAIDLDACTGCSSCVASCYIENNVPLTGEKEHLRGREMSWIRIEPYFNGNSEGEFLPLMCQQCDHAPCETVCPVYATYHNEEGLNAQVYNRCVGTRYCANNCPYKARRFNWFDNSGNLPLYSVHNTEISVRPKGVMEKCTFCIQRIRTAKDTAKDEKRDVKDGDITPACAQSCPTDAIVFGNLLDPNSKISKLIKEKKIFRVHESLGTRPAVYYLKDTKNGVITHFEKKLEEG